MVTKGPSLIAVLAQGFFGTVAALTAMLIWIAIGMAFLRRMSKRDALLVLSAVVIGSAISGFVLAICAWAGHVVAGPVLTFGAGLAALAGQRQRVIESLRVSANHVGRALSEIPGGRWIAGVLTMVMWVRSIAPPRDADVMRYHLAHIRQIIDDGRWQAMPNVHYALPFEWSINYLPFELLGLPQAASLVNLVVLAILAAAIAASTPANAGRPLALAAVLCIFAHPAVVRVFSSALADGSTIAIAAATGLVLMRFAAKEFSPALAGFIIWIGAGARYQAVAMSLAATIAFISIAAGGRQWRQLPQFLKGSAAALTLASPFYLANLSYFNNPVWPLMISAEAAKTSYVNAVGSAVIGVQTSGPRLDILPATLARLVSAPELLPLPLVAMVLIVAGLVRSSSARPVSLCGGVFFLIWSLSSPGLYPSYFLPLVGISVVLIVALTSYRIEHSLSGHALSALALAAAMSGAASAALSLDYFRYAVTGDATTFHRFTLYHPVFKWVNENTNQSDRFLVVLASGQSYYLDRPYRRADPWLTGEVDWTRVTSGAKLDSVLTARSFDYVIYDDRDWSSFVGGREMTKAVREGVAAGSLQRVHVSHERLYSSQVRRKFETTVVYVLKRAHT